MKVMAFEKIAVRDRYGLKDAKSYIAAGDLCTVSGKTLAGLYPVTYPTARGEKTRWVRDLKGFLCNQNDYGHLAYAAPGYESATVKSGGCGVCAAVNAVGALTGKQVPVREMRDLALTCGARVSGGTDMKRLTAALAKKYGLRCTQTNSVSQLKAHLEQGGVAICNTAGKGMFSTGGHYVVALGLLGGKVCLADPGLYAGKYSTARRLLILALISEIPFNYMVAGGWFYPFHQNTVFTLLLGYLLIWGLESNLRPLKKTALVAVSALVAFIGFVDYGWQGVFTVLLFYMSRKGSFSKISQLICMIIVHVFGMEGQTLPWLFDLPLQSFAVLALIPIWLYNGQKGRGGKAFQWAYYLYYPLHMMALVLLRYLL